MRDYLIEGHCGHRIETVNQICHAEINGFIVLGAIGDKNNETVKKCADTLKKFEITGHIYHS